MIVPRLIEELLKVPMHFGVIFRHCNLEIWDPSKFPINISLLTTQRGPWRHSCASNCILLVWI